MDAFVEHLHACGDGLGYRGRVGIAYPGQPGKATTFAYDGLDRRTTISRTPAGGGTAVTTSYLWCGSRICQARDGANAPTRSYYDEGEFVAGAPGQPLYYGIDQIGSVRRAFAGAAAPAYGYDPYGVPLQENVPLTDFGFAGMLREPDSGLHLTQYRAYDPVAGRWLSRDPFGESKGQTGATSLSFMTGALGPTVALGRSGRVDGSNPYTYGKSAPTMHVDLTGRNSIVVGGGIGGSIAGLPGAIAGAIVGGAIGVIALDWYFSESADKSRRSKPSGCPPGTVPVDVAKGSQGLDREDVHRIKRRLGAGPTDWVGISPDGDVWVGDENGQAVNEGPWKDLSR